MPDILLSKKDKKLSGYLTLPGSKSISNRVLIIDAYNNVGTTFKNISSSDDTKLLVKALKSADRIIDVGHAGTCFRFLTSYFSIQGQERILTGSNRLRERPIKPLVKALNQLGADISYLEKEGFAPILIKPVMAASLGNKIKIAGNISSQFISSLLMLGPNIPGGLEIELTEKMVSLSYINMTLKLMEEFGIEVQQTDSGFFIPEGQFTKEEYHIESDWSSASYILILCALSDEVEIILESFSKESLQGDSKIIDLLKPFGLKISFSNNQLLVKKHLKENISFIENDFISHPDLFQGLSVLYGINGISCLFSGLQTLKHKETDRIKAMKKELEKFQVFLSEMPEKFSKKTNVKYYTQEGNIIIDKVEQISTYDDHRMAMAFAVIGLLKPVIIKNSRVVSKSYPGFWNDLVSLGFNISTVET